MRAPITSLARIGLGLLSAALVLAPSAAGAADVSQPAAAPVLRTHPTRPAPVQLQRIRPTATRNPLALSVRGNQLINGRSQPVRLLGVDRSGLEYACVQGWGFFDGPSDDASIDAMSSWGVRTVRVPLNEDCWLGINGVSTTYGGAAYRSTVRTYVDRLHAHGMQVILDLHWNAPGGQLATGQQDMADADHAPAFWSSVATAFRGVAGVVFDLYNEPHDISWDCWRDGCTDSGGWQTAGMQQVVDAVRATGARQPIMLSGLVWGGDLSEWLAHEPYDPLHKLIAGVHIYNFSGCNTVSCWDRTIAPLAAQVPVVTGEIGEDDCAGGFVDGYLEWADAHGIGYLGWEWNTADCTGGPALITSHDGTPTAFGAAVREHLLQ